MADERARELLDLMGPRKAAGRARTEASAPDADHGQRLAEMARRKAAQKAAQDAVNAARVAGLRVALQEAKAQRRALHAQGAGANKIWVEGFRRGDGTWVEGHWRDNPGAVDLAARERQLAEVARLARQRGVPAEVRDLLARQPLMDRHLDPRGLPQRYEARLAPWQRGDWPYQGQEARAGGRPQDPMAPVINDVAGVLNPGVVGLGIASLVNQGRQAIAERELGDFGGELLMMGAAAAIPMAPKNAGATAAAQAAHNASLGRYSRLRRAAEQLPEKGTAEQMLGILRNSNLSPEEITWTNTDRFLAGKTMAEFDAAKARSGLSDTAAARAAAIKEIGDKIRAASGDEKKALIARRQELAAANKADLDADIAARTRAKAGGNQPDPAARTVTRDEILRHIDDNALTLLDVRYGGPTTGQYTLKEDASLRPGYRSYKLEGNPGDPVYYASQEIKTGRVQIETVDERPIGQPFLPGGVDPTHSIIRNARDIIRAQAAPDTVDPAKFPSYSDHARDNPTYRERLYQWQTPEMSQALRMEQDAKGRKLAIDSPEGEAVLAARRRAEKHQLELPSSHWRENGVVVHTRTATETLTEVPEGKGNLRPGDKTHDIKEIQTDWGQRGRDAGFQLSEAEMAQKRREAQHQLDVLEHEARQFNEEAKKWRAHYERLDRERYRLLGPWRNAFDEAMAQRVKHARKEAEFLAKFPGLVERFDDSRSYSGGGELILQRLEDRLRRDDVHNDFWGKIRLDDSDLQRVTNTNTVALALTERFGTPAQQKKARELAYKRNELLAKSIQAYDEQSLRQTGFDRRGNQVPGTKVGETILRRRQMVEERMQAARNNESLKRDEAVLIRARLSNPGTPSGPYVTSTENTTKFAVEQELINAARDPSVRALTITEGSQVSDRFGHNDKQRKGTAEFYDRIAPKVLREVVSKLDPDAKVETVGIRDKTGTPRPRTAVEITPRLRERILRDGIPLMGAAGLAGGFAVAGSGSADASSTPSLHAAAVLNRVRARRRELAR